MINMEPITVVLAAALASGLTEVGKLAVKDAYSALKEKLVTLLGKDSEPLKTLEKLESRPDSEGRRLMLDEEFVESKVSESAEIRELVETLSNKLKESDSGKAALAQFNINAETIGVVANTVEHIEQKF
jgi:hypothetical protein